MEQNDENHNGAGSCQARPFEVRPPGCNGSRQPPDQEGQYQDPADGSEFENELEIVVVRMIRIFVTHAIGIVMRAVNLLEGAKAGSDWEGLDDALDRGLSEICSARRIARIFL